jgi:hypothetical protein
MVASRKAIPILVAAVALLASQYPFGHFRPAGITCAGRVTRWEWEPTIGFMVVFGCEIAALATWAVHAWATKRMAQVDGK